MFALSCCHASVFAAQGLIESDCCISRRYAMLIIDDVFVLQAGVFAAQGQVEIDLGTSTWCMLSMVFAYVL